MKIALLISGAPRTMIFDECILHLKNFLNMLSQNNIEYDTFLMLKINENISKTPIDTKPKHYKHFLPEEAGNYFCSFKGLENFKTILKVLTPRFLKVINLFKKDNSCFFSQMKMIDILIEEAIKCEKKENKSYDFFLRTRPDAIFLSRPIVFTALKEEFIYTSFKKDTIGSDMFFIFKYKMLHEWWIKYVRSSFDKVVFYNLKNNSKLLPDFYIFNNNKQNVIQSYELGLIRDYKAIQFWDKKQLGKKIHLHNFWGSYEEYLKFNQMDDNFLDNLKMILEIYGGTYDDIY
tara:strand:- start:357 stop:1226 length:870 start_codon:yes stop_codon:yes gene_type:complete